MGVILTTYVRPEMILEGTLTPPRNFTKSNVPLFAGSPRHEIFEVIGPNGSGHKITLGKDWNNGLIGSWQDPFKG